MRAASSSPGAIVLGSDFKALGVIRSLGRHGIPSVVIDNTPRAAWVSRYVVARRRWEGAMEGERFVQFLQSLGREPRIKGWLLIPTQDEVVELVARNRAALSASFTPVTQSWETLRLACDKRLMNEMAQAIGVAYPATWYPVDEAQLSGMDVTFPAIVKPTVSIRLQHALRLKALPAASMDELLARYRLALQVIEPEEVMIQEIVPGGGAYQYSVAAYAHDGEIVTSMTARRTRQYPIDYGLGSSFVEALEVPDLLEDARKLIAHMRLTGMVEVEFKRDPRTGANKLLDINVRPWGWHTLTIACGLDLPWMHYCDIVGQPLPSAAPRYDYRWIRSITDLPAGMQEIRAGLTTPMRYLRSLLGRTTFSVWSWRDPLPALMDASSVVARAAASLRKSHTPALANAITQPRPLNG